MARNSIYRWAGGGGQGSFGSMLELSWDGKEPVQLDDGTSRSFLQDGDEVTMTGWCYRPASDVAPSLTIGFGECKGTVMPALEMAGVPSTD